MYMCGISLLSLFPIIVITIMSITWLVQRPQCYNYQCYNRNRFFNFFPLVCSCPSFCSFSGKF